MKKLLNLLNKIKQFKLPKMNLPKIQLVNLPKIQIKLPEKIPAHERIKKVFESLPEGLIFNEIEVKEKGFSFKACFSIKKEKQTKTVAQHLVEENARKDPTAGFHNPAREEDNWSN